MAKLILVPAVDHIVAALPVVTAVVRTDAEAIAEAARGLAPVRTGRYRGSITAALEPSSEGARGRVSASVPYAPFIEFGTTDTPAFAPISHAARGLGLRIEQ